MPKRRLKTLEDVRRFMASLINRTEAGELDPIIATKLGYLATSMIRVIEKSDHEERLKKLEQGLEIFKQQIKEKK